MINPAKAKATLAFILALASFAARGGIGSGPYTNDFNGAVSIWDLSGTYAGTNGAQTENYTIVMDANGVLSGNGTFNYNNGNTVLSGDYAVGGKVKSAGPVVRASITLNVDSGSGTAQGNEVEFTAVIKENLTLDGNARQLIGKSGGKVTITAPALHTKVARTAPSSDASTDLPSEVGRSWGLSLNLIPHGTFYTGTATMNLANGKKFGFYVAGTHSTKTDLATISLTSTNASFPMKLLLTASFNGSQMTAQSLKGRAFGQTLKFPSP